MFIRENFRNPNFEKCSRIFRPWDIEHQDATVSTTTKEEEIIEENCETKVEKNLMEKRLKHKKFNSTKQDDIRINSNSVRPKSDESGVRNGSVFVSESDFKSSSNPRKYLETNSSNNVSLSDSLSTSSLDSSKCAETSFIVTNPQALEQLPYTDYSLYPEMMQANLTQNLGIMPNDPLLLESIAQGYALEEYVRVLEQEHQTKILNSKKKRPKKYKCPHCDVGFSNNGQLKGHIRIHTGERPFKCDEKDCGKTFTRNEELTRHKRIHSGLRPFPCPQCGKRFGRKDHLKKHCRTHFQPRGFYAVPVMLPYDTWATNYPFTSPISTLY